MRKQSEIFKKKIFALRIEFDNLKVTIFNGSVFITYDETDPEVKRYNQLLGFFKPEFRYKNWINPLDEKIINPITREVFLP